VRTVFLGTSELAAAVLERLAASAHRPTLVVTRPDRPRGRGQRLESPPVAHAARTLGIPVYQPENVNASDALAKIADEQPQVLCMCAYGALLGDELLARWEVLNVHPSLLPRWRGAAPLERALEAGDPVTGVSIMLTARELDAGPVVLQAAEPILASDDWGSLSARIAPLAGDLLVRALDLRPPARPQPAYGVTYAPRIEREERRLDPALGCERLERRVRAFSPHIGCYVALASVDEEADGGERPAVDGKRSQQRLGVLAARALPGAPSGAQPGSLVASGERLFFVAVDGLLELQRVKAPGRRALSAAEFLRGHGRTVPRVEVTA
jgi:methionyl-tRNA formyltransferase